MTAGARWEVVGIGENSIDRLCTLPALPSGGTAGSKLPILTQALSPGGQVATTLCTCAVMGLATAYVGTFGNDEGAAVIRAELRQRGVDLSAAPVRDAPNRYAVILIDRASGERIVLWHRDPALRLSWREVPAVMIQRTRLLHVDATDPDAAIHAAALAQAHGVPVTCDVDEASAVAGQLLAFVSVPILAAHVPEVMTGERDPERALRKLQRPHHRFLCVTLGERGAMLLDGDRVHHQPGVRVNVVDTTGAGDVFRGALIAALLRGDDPAAMLAFANAAAAISCTRRGAIGGVPTREDVEALLAGRE